MALDLALLRARSRQIFEKAIYYTPRKAVGLFLLLIYFMILGLLSKAPEEGLLFVLTAFIACLYVKRHFTFKTLLRSAGTEESHPKLIFASEAVEIFLLFFMWSLIGGFVYGIGIATYKPLGISILEDVSLQIFSCILMFVLIYRFSRKQNDLSFPSLTGLYLQGQAFWKIWVLPPLLGLACGGLNMLISSFHQQHVETPFVKTIETIDSTNLYFLFVVSGVIVAPFFEEVIFRGFFFSVIKRLKDLPLAIVLVSIGFALVHVPQDWGDPVQIVMLLVFSIGLTYLRSWTGSTIPGIIVHFFYNSSLLLIAFMLSFGNFYFFKYEFQSKHLSSKENEVLLLESIRQSPKFAPPYNELAWKYAEEDRNLDKALVLVDTAISLDPQGYCLDTKAEILYKKGRVQEAVHIESGLVKRYPKFKFYQEQLKKFKQRLERRNEVLEREFGGSNGKN